MFIDFKKIIKFIVSEVIVSYKNFLYEIFGDASLSKWCQEFLDVNPEQSSWRENAGLFEEEKKFWKPAGIETNENLIFISDSCRHRLQIYRI